MTITIELAPELEAQLHQAAARQGQEPAAFAQVAVEEKLRFLDSIYQNQESPVSTYDAYATLDQFEAGMDELTKGSEHLPVLSADAFSRENIYGDHD